MNMLTVARRASLGASMNARFEEAYSKLATGRNYYKVVSSKVPLDSQQREFHDSIYLMGVFSIAEALFSDIAVHFLVCNPGHLHDKNVTLDSLSKSASLSAAIRQLAEKMINKMSYGKFDDYINEVAGLFNKKLKFNNDLVDHIIEIKATRDVYVHAGGNANTFYYQKAGNMCRDVGYNKKLPLGENYISNFEEKILALVTEFDELIPDKMKKFGKASAFREMWDFTVLSELLPFDEAWTVENQDMVRPNDEGLKRYWSHSEKPLVDFFVGIYSQGYPSREYDTLEALRRWSPETNEGKVIVSWMDSPFWF